MIKFIEQSLLLLLCISLTHVIYAQTDSIRYTPEFKFRDGLYLNFEQFKQNKPISTAKIMSSGQNLEQLWANFNQLQSVSLYDENGMLVSIPVEQFWGYSRNGVVYINYNEEFNRIPIIGRISHFISNKTVVQDRYVDPYSYRYQYNPSVRVPVSSQELREYLLDFKTGQVYNFELKNLEILLSADLELYEEFMDLRKRKRKKLKYLYLRKFNEKHPIYIPIPNLSSN